jgi:hypothetical protein
MSNDIYDMSFVLTKDPINLDEERMFRSYHGGLSPDEYIDKHQILLPYPVPNCTPATKAALALQGFEAYDPLAPRRPKYQESDHPEPFEEFDMKAALKTLTAAWSQTGIKSPDPVEDSRKEKNHPLPARAKNRGMQKLTMQFEGPKPNNINDWEAINARLQRVIDKQMDYNASRVDPAGSGGSTFFPVVWWGEFLTMLAVDPKTDHVRDEGNVANHPFLNRKKVLRATIPKPRFEGPKPETVGDWGGTIIKLQNIINQQTVINPSGEYLAGSETGKLFRRGGSVLC